MTHKPTREEISEVIRQLWSCRGYWVVCSPPGKDQFWVGCPVFSLCGVSIPFEDDLAIAEQTSPEEWDEQVELIAKARPEWNKAQPSTIAGVGAKFFRAKKVTDCPDFVVEIWEREVADDDEERL